MNESGKTNQPLARLVLFMICLAIAGTILAGFHYFVVDLPQQNAIRTAPSNLFLFKTSPCETDCFGECKNRYDACMASPKGGSESRTCDGALSQCESTCTKTCACSDCQNSCDGDYMMCLGKPGYTEGDCAGIRDTCTGACPC